MPLFSGNRGDNGSIEYTAVGNDVPRSEDDQRELQPTSNTVEAVRASLDTSGIKANSTTRSKAVDYQVLETGSAPSEKTPGSNNGPTITGWPQGPRKLRGFSAPFLVGDALLILLPVAFLVLAISAWQLHGKELSDTGKMVERAMNLGPTIYPLAFAAIGSRCLRSIAIRLAERGTTLSTLEKLLGSQSLVSAVGTAFTLRSTSAISVLLVLLWALSPLGGQSSLRLLHETNSTISQPGKIYYSDPAAPMNLDESGSWFQIVPTILSAGLASTAEAKGRPMDLWNHPKIPRLESIEQGSLKDPNSEGDWIDVNIETELLYSSWTGVIVQGLRQNEHSEFQIEHDYLYLECRKLYSDHSPRKVLDNLLASTMSFYPQLFVNSTDKKDYSALQLTTVKVQGQDTNITSSFSLYYGYNTTLNTDDPPWSARYNRQPVSFLYGASFQDPNDLTQDGTVYQMYECKPNLVAVDARVKCDSGDCAVSQLRRKPLETALVPEDVCSGALNKVGCFTEASYSLLTFFRYLPSAMASYYEYKGRSPFEAYIGGSNTTYQSFPNEYTPFTNVSDRMISERLTTILNTYWQAGSWGPQITKAALFEIPEYPFNGTSDSVSPYRWINETESVFSYQIPVYRADVGWIVTLILITIALLLLSIANVIISAMTVAPDLFYYASSLVRENPYANTPDGGTALDGAERSRLLKNMKVQVADVSPENEIGYVALKSVDDDERFHTGRLKKGRLYW